MDLGLNEQQEMLRRTAREFLEAQCPISLVRECEDSESGYSSDLWAKMAQLGWMGLAFSPEYGGTGGSLLDQVVLFEELGRAIAPGPHLTSTVIAGQVISDAGSAQHKTDLLPHIADGSIIATVALSVPDTDPDGVGLVAHREAGGDYSISGTKLFVPYAQISHYVLCSAGSSLEAGETLFLIDTRSEGITMALMESVAAYKQHEVVFSNVAAADGSVVGEPGGARSALAKALEWSTVVQCAEMVGRAEKVLEMVVDYSKVRVQFGRPIGAFQAVQHRCADLKVSIDGARLVTHQAAWKLAQGLPCSEDVSMAKAFAGTASRLATVAGHAIFAGVAFTVEHDMQLYTMRSKIAEASLGDTDSHLDTLAQLMGSTA